VTPSSSQPKADTGILIIYPVAVVAALLVDSRTLPITDVDFRCRKDHAGL
jgi:hypothetical protein